MSERCGSCGILFTEHSGVIATCAKLAAAEQECERLRADLKEALDEWGYSSGYKGKYLQEKHNDLERIREIRESHFGSAARTGGGEGGE